MMLYSDARLRLIWCILGLIAVLSIVDSVMVQTCSAQQAKVGEDKTLAPGLLMVLDGMESTGTGSLRYRWTQISGDAVEIIGWDRPCAFVVAPELPGNYVFRVTVKDDVGSDTNDVTLTVVSYEPNILFVDGTIGSASCADYDPTTRTCGSGTYTAYKTLQSAGDIVNPGDMVYVREGTYNATGNLYASVLSLLRSGTATAPITFAAYNGETVVLNSTDDSYPTGRARTVTLGAAAHSSGDPPGTPVSYIIVEGFEIIGGQIGARVAGGILGYESHHITFRNCVFRDNPGNGFYSTGCVEALLVAECEVKNNQLTGLIFGYWGEKGDRGAEDGPDRVATKYSLAQYNVCHHNVDIGDGNAGNCDGLGGGFNYRTAFYRNVTFSNDDDGMDIYGGLDVLVEENIAFDHNGEGDGSGIKMGTGGGGRTVARGNVTFANKKRGFDCDTPNSYANPNYGSTFYHNTVYYNNRWGFMLIGDIQTEDPNSKYVLYNNIALDNDQANLDDSRDDINGPTDPNKHDSNFNRWKPSDLTYMQTYVDADANSISDDPVFVNQGISIDTTFTGMTIREKVDYVRNQVRQRFSLSADSTMIDAGTIIPGYHFDTPGEHPGQSGRVWYGAAPDLGAFERVLFPITDLSVTAVSRNSLTLSWTVPGSGNLGARSTRYDIRYSSHPITMSAWSTASQALGVPIPGDLGATESFTLTGLHSGTDYYVVVQTRDDVGNTSGLSNIVSGTTTSSGNHAPVFTPIGDRTVAVGEPVTFTVGAADADGDGLTYSAGGLPSGAAFNAATQTFTWTPTNAQSGLYWITFAVTDGQVSISETICITVKQAVNHAPVLAAIGNKNVNEGQTLTFTVSATDSDGDSLTYSASNLPSGSSFAGQTFTWMPTYDQTGSYSVTFTVSDGQSTDSELITIAVANVAVDQAAPAADPGYPAADEIQVPLNPAISLTVSDAGQGVDASTVTVRVNDQLVYSGNTASHQSAYGVCRRTGTSASYRYTYQPAASFAFDELVTVRVTASDLAGNAMTPYVYSFTTEMRVFGDNRPASWAPEDLDKSRPATVRDSQGNVWLAYQAGPSGQRGIYVCSLPPGSAYFGSSVQLTTNSADQAYPTIGIGTDNRLYVAWQDNRRGNWDIYISTSSDGLTWSAETPITDSDDNQTRPVLAVDRQSPNRVHVAWQGDDAGNPDIYIATSSNAFATTTVAQVTTNAADQTAPAIAVDASNNAYLVWTDSRNGASDIYGAASNSGPWTNVPIATGAGYQTAAVIATESAGTMLHFAWVDDSAGNRDIRYASSNGMPSSALAGSNIVDDTSGADQTAPTIATVGSTGNQLGVFICWVDARNLNPNGWDTDLYLVDVGAGQRTNVLVGDAGTGSDQAEPAVGVDLHGYPYVLWTDNRNAAKYVYYAGSTYMAPEPLAAAPITAATGGTVGTASPTSASDVSAVIPSGASPQDVTVEIAQVLNPQSIVGSNVLAYDFGPSGLEFSRPVTLTIPYPVASFSGGMPVPCWYVSETGTLSQQGITNPRVVDISSGLKALRFETTHFTPYYLLESFVDDGDDDGWSGDDGGGGSSGGGGGGGGGGCTLAPGESGSLAGFLLPYIALAAAMLALRRHDRRRQNAQGR